MQKIKRFFSFRIKQIARMRDESLQKTTQIP